MDQPSVKRCSTISAGTSGVERKRSIMGGLEVNRFKTFKKLVESKILSKSDRSLQEIGKKLEEAFFVKCKQYFSPQIQTECVQVLEMEDLLWPWDQLLDLIAMGNLIKL